MARYKLILAYDGTAFAGSQRQAGNARVPDRLRRTIQGDLEEALRGLHWQGRSILLAGRTDAGVHASGQVAGVDLDWLHSPQELRDALNARLPFDLVVRDVQAVEAGFHPRFDARSRSYRYSLFCGHIRDPLSERFAWRVWPEFDPKALLQTARVFMGRHDFKAFGSPPTPKSGTVRTVLRSEWSAGWRAGMWHFDVAADAFLYRMVRRLVFMHVAVAQGRCSIEAVLAALNGGDARELPAGLAPAHGLELMQVDY